MAVVPDVIERVSGAAGRAALMTKYHSFSTLCDRGRVGRLFGGRTWSLCMRAETVSIWERRRDCWICTTFDWDSVARRWVICAQGGSFPRGVWNQIVLSWDGIAFSRDDIVDNCEFFFDGGEADLPVMLQSTERPVERGWPLSDMVDLRQKFARPCIGSSCVRHHDLAMTPLHSRERH